jgi:ABC-2 type transport system permease protein
MSWFLTALRTGARRMYAEWPALVVAAFFYLVVVTAVTTLWRTGAAASGGHIAGYSATMLTWYLATSEASILGLSFRLIEEVGDDIASGSVATELLRPVSVLGIRIGTEVGRSLARLSMLAPVGAAFCLVVVGPPPHPAALLLAVPALLLAVTCNILLQHAVAGMSFWIRDARSGWFLYQKLVFILGGMLVPLEVLPAGLRHVAEVLPLAAVAYAPARLASGHIEPQLLVLQLAWLAVAAVVATLTFNAGERRLQVVGG